MTAPRDPECGADACVTCSDAAVVVRVVRLLDDDLAIVATGSGPRQDSTGDDGNLEEVSVAFVTAGVGDSILVHAGEAIAVVGDEGGGGR